MLWAIAGCCIYIRSSIALGSHSARRRILKTTGFQYRTPPLIHLSRNRDGKGVFDRPYDAIHNELGVRFYTCIRGSDENMIAIYPIGGTARIVDNDLIFILC